MEKDDLYEYLRMNIGMEFPCTAWDEEKEEDAETIAKLYSITSDKHCELVIGDDYMITVMYDILVPTLRRMSDMTEKEKEYYDTTIKKIIGAKDYKDYAAKNFGLLQWLNKNKLDYFGFIDKGLAYDAKDGIQFINL